VTSQYQTNSSAPTGKWSFGRRALAIGAALVVAGAVAFAVTLPATGAGAATKAGHIATTHSKAATKPAATTDTKITLASGEATNSSSGLDTATSFCQNPTGITSISAATIPVNPTCESGLPANPYVVTSPIWSGTISGAQWDGTSPSGSDSSNNPPAYYVYDAEFNVCQTNGTSGKGQLLADNAAGVYLNGNYVASQTDSAISSNFNNPPFAYSLPAADLVVGVNTIDFVVNDITPPYTGLDYLVKISTPSCGILKVCKVAGFGITVGSPFNFTVGATTTSVPAGPAPGGYCDIVGTYPVGSDETVVETIPGGDQVEAIQVEPSTQLVSDNLTHGKVKVAIGTGVTEVTYTNQSEEAAKAGWLEICKQTPSTGTVIPATFQFTVNGNPVSVPSNACTSAIQVPAGQTQVIETPADGYGMTACSAISAAYLLSCTPSSQTAVVQINPGNISTETILEVTDGPTDTGT
jgi:hypothetical protein